MVETAVRPKVSSVLLVEDNAVNQQVITLMLRKFGCEVRVAHNGLEALEQVEQFPFHLVLMDLHMPGMDGLRATRLIRAREKVTGRRVPIVAVTASVGSGERQRCLAAGMNDYITKPVRRGDLEDLLQRLLGPPVADSAPPTGWRQTLARLGFDHSVIADLVRMFLETTPPRLADLACTLQEGNASKARALAHTLKGSLLVFGVDSLVQAARQLEESAIEGRLDKSVEWLLTLNSGLREFMVELNAYLNTQSQSAE